MVFRLRAAGASDVVRLGAVRSLSGVLRRGKGAAMRFARRRRCVGGRCNEKIPNAMKNWKGMQAVRLAAMVLAIAGIIYALEFMDRRLAVWFWVGVLGVGFVGLLYTFRIEQRRMRLERRAAERRTKRPGRRSGRRSAR